MAAVINRLMGFLRSLARVIVAIIAGIVILLLLAQDQMIYHPRPYPSTGTQNLRQVQTLPYTTTEGTQDDLIPFTMGKELAGISPQVRFEAIEGAGHNDILTLAQDQIFRAMRSAEKKP